ncbi:hypothetical protein EV702DRAFT_1098247 [Suillus placidus]|uniref:PAN2-PAN3 deadenylation complex subunit PAN3 n=1 Tax=Suillus placidus TaxID=48579 RepID=A0A9P6ZWC2_9AGAM|nr:hypothetical protein EV702DRAFT_1098247 [Suillus placidus]
MAYFSSPRPQSSSSAIKIVNPAEHDDKAKLQAKRDSPQRQCRNILIYGSCRYQDKGCIYYHPPVEGSNNPPRPDSPLPASLSAQAVNAPVFVPKAPFHAIATPSPTSASPFTPSPSPSTFYPNHAEYDDYGDSVSNETPQTLEHQLVNQYQQVDYDDHASPMGNFYQSQQTTFVRQPLDYHLYSHPTPDAFPSTHFVSDAIREELHNRSETSQLVPLPGHNLPDELQGYHSLALLEPSVTERRKFFSWYSTVYRATSSNDGVLYALRRIENFRLMHQAAFGAIETWSRVEHPSIVRVREAFTTRAFNDNSLVVAYEYYPNAQTLFEMHIKQKPPVFQHGRLSTFSAALPEATLWSYMTQIASAIKVVHEAGLAVRMVDATKIMVTGKNRIRIGSCGIADVLMYDPRQDTAVAQQEDLAMFGRLVFALCCNNLAAMNTLPKALDVMGRQYSADVKALALYLISKPGPHKNITQVIDMIGTNRLLHELDDMHSSVNRLEAELMSELENGRLVRLLCKFGFINERPVFAREPRWSETGDRYIIKLFRDYVFHQVDENGNPVINLSHVLACLNKLDAGTDERIMLVSRDEQSCLVVSYKDVKACIDAAFGDLARASR